MLRQTLIFWLCNDIFPKFLQLLWEINFNLHFIFAGEGQLEISINDGDVPNAVQVLGGGKCLVTYTPEQVNIEICTIISLSM